MIVPLLDLKAQYQTIREEIRAEIDRVCESQHFILGPDVTLLEQEIAAYCGVPHAVGVSSGTDALLVALMALGVQAGDEVVTTPYSFFATAGVVSRLGARPVFADVELATGNLDARAAVAAISRRAGVILPVHLFGRCAEMDPLLAATQRSGLHVLEDAAQAIGAFDHAGRQAGTIGTIGCFSFFPSKNLGAFGDAGMVITADETISEQLRVLRVHGTKPKYHHRVVGGNFRLDALQAAILRVKLRHLDEWTKARRRNAARYRALLDQAGLNGEIQAMPDEPGHIYNQFVIQARNRNRLREFLQSRGIGTEVYYPVPLHLQECFRDLGYRKGDFPNAERLSEVSLALPVYPELTDAQIEYVAAAIRDFYRQQASNRGDHMTADVSVDGTPATRSEPVRVACVGLGYWGPNVLRAFVANPRCDVRAYCDLDPARLSRARSIAPGSRATQSLEELLDDPEIEAFAVTTPAATHSAIVRQVLERDRHVFVEKPLALIPAEAAHLSALARARDRVLMIGHLLLFHPAIRQLKRYIDEGELGEVRYIYSTRVNLGQIRSAENALWSLAPHDVSVALYLLGERPLAVSAVGGAYLQAGVSDVVFLTMTFAGERLVHAHVSWLDPHRVRKVTIVGTKKMAVFDDVEIQEKIRLYDKGVDVSAEFKNYAEYLSLRNGDIYIPRVPHEEPLRLEVDHFLEAVKGRRPVTSDGDFGVDVVRILAAADRSLQKGGIPIDLALRGLGPEAELFGEGGGD